MSDKYHVSTNGDTWEVWTESGVRVGKDFHTRREAQRSARDLAALEVVEPIRDRYSVTRVTNFETKYETWQVNDHVENVLVGVFDYESVADKVCDQENEKHRKNKKSSVVVSDVLMMKLQEAGVIGENNYRVIIDLQAGQPIRIYTRTYGSDVLLAIMEDTLRGAEVWADGKVVEHDNP